MARRKLSITRRSALAGLGAVTFASTRTAFGQSAAQGNKLIIVILRGALDGLAAVPKLDDENLRGYRKNLIPDGARMLRDGFGLHPSLETVHKLFEAGDASVLHAVAGPYRDRSHFLAQDLLETGTAGNVTPDGWLNRALQAAPAPLSAVSIGPASPLILRGSHSAASWSPPALPEAGEDTIMRLMQLYENDDLLGPALAQAVELDEIARGNMKSGSRRNNYQQSLSAAGRLLAAQGGPDIAVAALSGWDTHANQPGTLNTRLRQLDQAIAALKTELGPVWQKTAVAVVTEFGRTIRQNGTRGTDHGTAGAAFILGGAVAGGRILGDWPGLGEADLFEGRDLMPANDMRALFIGLLERQFGFEPKTLSSKVFPGSQSVRAIEP